MPRVRVRSDIGEATWPFRIRRADVTRLPMRAGRGFDVVAANLLADLLISERDRLLARVAPGGVILLAGILESQFPVVASAYMAAGLEPLRAVTQGEWRSGAFRRPLGVSVQAHSR